MSAAERSGHGAFDLKFLAPSPTNPRKSIDAGRLQELAQSIRSQGVIQPILLRPWPESHRKLPAPDVSYEVVVGERRYRAALLAGLTSIPAVCRELTDAQVEEIQVIENLQREDISALEEAEGYRQLMRSNKGGVAAVAARIGKSEKYVYDRVKLLDLTKAAAELLRSGKITNGHAILLARLTPAQQATAIDEYKGGLWEPEMALFHLDESGRAPLKARSVRELAGWIDQHVRFDAKAADVPQLFPETFAVVTQAAEAAEKVVHITEEYSVHPDARGENHILGPRSWKRADGSNKKAKTCEHAITGVVVVGPGRGEAFKVCTAKKACRTHWAEEQREAKAAANRRAKDTGSGEDRYKKEQERGEAEEAKENAARDRWRKAAPTILAAVAAAVKKAPAKATGFLAELLLKTEELRFGYGSPRPPALGTIVRGRSAEDLVRHLAYRQLVSGAYDYTAHQRFPKLVKGLGIDAAKILAEAVPEPKASPAPAKAPKAKAKKPAKRKAA
jgi:ParB/RepB/Spo0J family partition protein